jgi:hypothetical protein
MWLVARAEVLQTAQRVPEQLRKEVARSEAMEHELVGLRSTVDRLQNEVSHTHTCFWSLMMLGATPTTSRNRGRGFKISLMRQIFTPVRTSRPLNRLTLA